MKNVSLKSTIIAIVGALALMLMGNVGKQAFDAWQIRQLALEQSTVTAAADLTLMAFRRQVRERALANAIFLAQIDTSDIRAELNEIRKQGDSVFARAIEGIAGIVAGHGEALDLVAVKQAFETFVSTRKELDGAAAAKTVEARANVLTKFQKAAAALSEQLETVRLSFTQKLGNEDPALSRLSNLKHLDWVIAENGLGELQTLGENIAKDEPVSPDGLAKIAKYQGSIDVAWKTLLGSVGSKETSLYEAITHLERGYFGASKFKKTRGAVFTAGLNAESYGVAAKAWFKQSGDALEHILTAQDRIIAVARDYSLKAVADAERTALFMGGLLFAGIALTVLSFWIILVRLVRPMASMTACMAAIAEGDSGIEIPYADQKDEIGAMAGAVDVFKRNMIENERLQIEQREAEKCALEDERKRDAEKREADRKLVEQNERDAAAQKQRAEKIEALIAEFDRAATGALDSVASAASQVQSTAESMSANADQTNQQAVAVAAASEEATVNVQTVASSAEELSASIEEIARQVNQSNEIAQNAVNEARQTNEKVEGLSAAAQKIGDVVNLINDIASQTNLLALNATIEAARAGDAGKGFAVVASEVKSLATQTGKATEEIGAQITAIQGATGEAVQAIQGIGATIGQLGEIATSVASAVTQQGSATREIASSVQQAAAGTQEVSGTIVQVTQAAGETQSASGEMLESARNLTEMGNGLRKEVDKFLEQVRAA